MKLNKNKICFTGGGTGGHIYPGLAVLDELRVKFQENNISLYTIWIGCSKGMDKNIVSKAKDMKNEPCVNKFYGIPSGKLRRYFSLKNISDVFKIIGGFFVSLWILAKEKPAALFSKGGFVSVPPCLAAKILKIPVYTHECDFTLGLANKINLKSASKMFVSYEETKNLLSQNDKKKVIVSGNPVRPVFYNADIQQGFNFLGIKNKSKPILLVVGGSSGARQINQLVYDNIDFLCENFIVVHQTGLVNTTQDKSQELVQNYSDYHHYDFIYEQMPNVVAASDIVMGRAGANSIWEAAVLLKPMLLIPLCGHGTRGDQVDNAKFFEEKRAAKVLIGQEVSKERLVVSLKELLDEKNRLELQNNLKQMIGNKKPANIIAEYIFENI
ncbi:MAG: UDP-N-acetylglucosamine--N-acetylmuramyl-(pentapeptide) pyrophosphoryl-undecaprenol N-acetylglucosamine transferase [Spirochaetia bacterium]|nr:UDP-N-acetylglucosamine--N-acetylmuramyl-(pentapeptide) pyrophosphoryl-undecaprenol N-acetylglucosamine transferase [Spirochaetia bacterium]